MSVVVRALLAAAVLGVLLPVASAASAQESSGADLDVVAQTPWVDPEGLFLLSLDVHDAPEGSRIETTFYSQRVANRAAFNVTLFGAGLEGRSYDLPTIDVDDEKVVGPSTRRTGVSIALVNPGPQGAGRITFEEGLRGAGAYPLDVRLIGPDDEELDRLITHLVRLPADLEPVEPLRAAMVFPVHAPPSVGPDGRRDLQTADLDRIGGLVDALGGVPYSRATIVPTPETIEALAREPGRPRELLDLLDDAVPGNQVVDGPYVDVPVSAWISAGMQDELNRQRGRGNAVLTEHLEAPDRTVWVASPDLTAEAAAELWEGGVTRFVLPETSFDPLPVVPEEPTPARPFEIATRIDAPVQAAALDSSLSYALGRGDYDDPELQAQELVAQLAVIQGEAPERTRGVVFGAERGQDLRWRVLSEALALLESHPLVRLATVADVFDDVEPARDPAGGAVVQRDLQPAPGPILGTYPTRLAILRARIASFSQMAQQSDGLLASWEQRLLISGAEELTPAERDAYLATIDATINRRIAAIQSPPKQSVTLTSNEGVIPFTVRNLLRQPVNVTLELEGTSRLEFPGGERRTEAILVEPGTNQIPLRVHTRSPGVSPVTVRVTSPDGGLLVTTSRVTVRSTAVSGIGYVLSVGAALFLLVWWFRHWRRARSEKHALSHVTAPHPAGS